MTCNKVVDYRPVQVSSYIIVCLHISDYVIPQSNEVGGSYHMEKEGLQRVLSFLGDNCLYYVQVLVTDRHKQINKWLRETHPSITHYFDV